MSATRMATASGLDNYPSPVNILHMRKFTLLGIPNLRAMFALCAMLASTLASAQTTGCDGSEEFSQFDFWVGDWQVYDNVSGKFAGNNSIKKLEQGCLLQESWQGAGGGTGTSINYYNPVRGEWRQVWVSAGRYAIDIAGGIVNGAMVLTGVIDTYNGVSASFRGIWTPNADGSVRQLFEQLNSDTGVWDVWFDGRYEPLK